MTTTTTTTTTIAQSPGKLALTEQPKAKKMVSMWNSPYSDLEILIFSNIRRLSPFSSMGEITVDPKGVAKLLDGLNVKRLARMDSMPESSKSVVHRFHIS